MVSEAIKSIIKIVLCILKSACSTKKCFKSHLVSYIQGRSLYSINERSKYRNQRGHTGIFSTKITIVEAGWAVHTFVPPASPNVTVGLKIENLRKIIQKTFKLERY